MGKGTILSHLGEGKYRIRLNRSTARIQGAITQATAGLADLHPRIAAAYLEMLDAHDRLSAAIAAISAAITAINERVRDLANAVRSARERVDQRTDELRVAQEALDQLEAWQREDPESVADEQIRIATELRDEKQALLDEAKDQLTDATDAWNDRDVQLKEQDEKIVAAAKIKEEWQAAQAKYGALVLERTSLERQKAWMESQNAADPTVEAWCADLTENLDGDVGTIEIPGERTSASDPIVIRPGYDHRAAYQAGDPHQALVDAKTAALEELIIARDRADAAVFAKDIEQSKRNELAARVANLLARPDPPAAEIVFLQGQIEAADARLPVLEARRVTMDVAQNAAQTALNEARQTLANARDADEKPRLADGMLQGAAASAGPFSSFFNRALLPAWQKWRPMYRVGEITALAGDQASVRLDACTSSQQSLSVNRESLLTGVPIEYMDCNGAAFVVGDRVVVEFQNQDQERPKVVGFESRPRACGDHGIIGALAGDDAPLGYSRTKVGSLYYADYKTLRFRNDAWTLGAQPSGVSVNGGRTFGQFDWVYRRDGKFKGYVTWGSPASNSNGLFFTWFQYQCPNRFGDYYSPNILPITYDGRASAASASVFLDGRLYARPAGLIQNKECAGAAIRHVTPAATPDNPNPTERRYLLMVIDKSVLALSSSDRGNPLYPFGADIYAVDITDGPVDTNTKWAAKARLIHTIGQLTFSRSSIGNGAYGGVDRFTTYGARGVRFRFNGSATRASAVVQTVCELGYDWNGDARWHDLSEAPMVVHIDIAADLTCTHTVEEPVAGTFTFGGSRWRKKTNAMSTVPLPGQPDPPPELVGETHYTGSGSVPETTLMIDYAGDVEKRVTATNTLDYRCHQTFMTWAPPVPFDIELNHEITTRIGRHTVTELYREERPLGEMSTTIWSGTKTERFQFLAVDPRYDFYAGLRMIYETTDADPTSPNLPDGARVTFELEVNGRVIQRSELPSIWWQSTTWTPIWNIGGLYNYINTSINVEWAFNTANGTSSRSGAYCLRPIRRATFRVSEPFKWYLDADVDPDWALKIQTTPVIDFIPYALCLTDVATGEAPKTLFVTNCPTLSAASISGKKSDGWGVLAQHQWICLMVDADGNTENISEVFGKPGSVHPRFCGAGLV